MLRPRIVPMLVVLSLLLITPAAFAQGTQTFNSTGAVQTFTVPPSVQALTIQAIGAGGGSDASGAAGGKGASVQGSFAVTPGEVLTVVVGGAGANGTAASGGFASGGGGGGAFVYRGSGSSAMLLLAGGGGGGAGAPNSNGAQAGRDASAVLYFGATAGGNGGTFGGGGQGGACSGAGGGGGGLFGNGTGGAATCANEGGHGGAGIINGGAGGSANSGLGTSGAGGFGGGGGGGNSSIGTACGGGGGGYSGGGGGQSGASTCGGGGGGSYNGGISQVNSSGANAGSGRVVISWQTGQYGYTGSLQNLVIPSGVSTVTIKAIGAAGGIGIPNPGYGGNRPGYGASMQGDFAVTAGDTLSILVGGVGGSGSVANQGYGSIAAAGGGGASVIWKGTAPADLTSSTLLLAAGGGGGEGSYQDSGFDASTGTSGGSSWSLYSGGYSGGTNGFGGGAYPCIGGGGGGAGVYGNGVNAGQGGNTSTGAGCYGAGGGGGGGQAINAGGAGGAASPGGNAYSGNSGPGGYGGGGGGGNGVPFSACGGAGGGYSGGAGGLSSNANDTHCGGSGGGSFNGGTNQDNAAGVGTGNGLVLITYDPAPNPSAMTAQLQLNNILFPGSDPGIFNLLVDGAAAGTGANVGNGGTTGNLVLSTGAHTVAVTAAAGTDMTRYQPVISCSRNAGAGAVVASVTGAGPLNVTLNANDYVVCFVTETLRPTISLLPSSLTFPDQVVGTTSSAQPITVTNNGPSQLVVSSISASGDFSQTNNCGTVAANGTCTINVKFSPTIQGTRTGSVSVQSNAIQGTVSAPLSGNGVQPVAVASVPSLSFGSMRVGGTTAAQTVTITNQGPVQLLISSVSSSTNEFVVQNNCPSSVPSGGTCNVLVSFAPKSTGPRTAILTMTSNSSAAVAVNLDGTGTTPVVAQVHISSSPSPSVFGQPVTLTAQLTPATGTTIPTGTVTFYDGNTTLGTATLDSTGSGTFNMPLPAVGTHSIFLSYPGDAVFQPYNNHIQFPVTTALNSTPSGIVTGDFNHDGTIDIAVGTGSTYSYGYLGFINGTSVQYFTSYYGAPQSLVTGDFNGDGVPDVAFADSSPYGYVNVAYGNASYGLGYAYPYPTSARYLYSLAAGDLDGDGKADLAFNAYGSTSATAYLPGSQYGFGTQVALPINSYYPTASLVADLNGDGAGDYLALFGSSAQIAFSPSWSVSSVGAGSSPADVAAGVLTSSGRNDLVFANSNGVTYLQNSGSGAFASPATISTGGRPWKVRIADMNGDGLADLVVAFSDRPAVATYLNQGSGAFTLGGTYTFSSGYIVGISVAPVKAGFPASVFVALQLPNQVVRLRPNGVGVLEAASDIGGAFTQTVQPATVTAHVVVGNKPYDGTTAATITGRSLTGVVGSDSVSLTGGTATFTDAVAGTGKTVNVTGLSLTGTNAANYQLAATTATATADITPAGVTASVTASNKVYDTTTNATITGCTLSGVLSSDTVTCSATVGSFSDKNAGTAKTVTATNISIGGASAGNYSLTSTSATTTANITQAAATVTASSPTVTYGSPVPTVSPIYSGFLSGDTALSAVTVPPACTTTYLPGANAGSAQTTSCTGGTAPNYSFAYAPGTLTVIKANAAIVVNGYAGVYDGLPHGATGTATGVGGANLTAQLSLGATFTLVPGGTANWTFAGGTNYNNAGGSVAIVIAKATPVITWSAPAAISQDTALSSTQLNASASVPGTFVYNPPAGTVLNPGTQTLSVTFAPTDSNDFTAATATVQITVNPTGNLNVGPGQTVTFTGGTLPGVTTVGSGGTLVLNNSQTSGNVNLSTGGSLVLNNTNVAGNVTLQNGGSVTLASGAVVQGNLTMLNGGSITTTGGTVSKNLQISGAAVFSLTNTVVGESLQIQDIPAGTSHNQVCGVTTGKEIQVSGNGVMIAIGSQSPSCAGNTVGSSLQVTNNLALVDVFNNQITSKLQCSGNSSILGGGNTASAKQGQCATF